MARLPSPYPNEFRRYIGGRWYEGCRFFDTKEIALRVAKEARRAFGISARMVVIPRSYGVNGYDERYLIMLMETTVKYDDAEKWIYQQPRGFPGW